MTVQSLLADPAILGNWTLVAERSSVRFTTGTLWGLVKVHGEFTDFHGAGQIGADGVVAGKLNIRAASVRTGIGKRDEHLRSADFFDADNAPEISVDISGVVPAGEHTADVSATMTIRGTTLPLPLQATVTRLDNDSLHLVGRTTVDRTRWGVSGNMMGMMPAATDLVADTIFVKA